MTVLVVDIVSKLYTATSSASRSMPTMTSLDIGQVNIVNEFTMVLLMKVKITIPKYCMMYRHIFFKKLMCCVGKMCV